MERDENGIDKLARLLESQSNTVGPVAARAETAGAGPLFFRLDEPVQ